MLIEEISSTENSVEEEEAEIGEKASEALSPIVSEEQAVEAENEKNNGNVYFKERRFEAAIVCYSSAIELNPLVASYYSNRAVCYIRTEAYGAAIIDATKALEVDPTFVKARYRRGDANFCLGKFKAALRDLKACSAASPKDLDLKKKLQECEKEVKRQKFEEALAVPDGEVVLVSSTIQLETMRVEDSYTGPRMKGSNEEGYTIDLDFVQAMLNEFKEQRLIHKRFAYEILLKSQALFKAEASLVDITIPSDEHITVCGDVHGQYYDLLHIFEVNGLPSPTNPYLFNGDFVDRGSFSVEVIYALLAFKVLYPNHMFLTRGNHETKNMNKIYGFEGEVKAKFSQTMMSVFQETFNWLPLGYVINARVLVLHGGLFSKDGVTLDDLRKIDRFREPPDEGLMCEMLWSDPGPLNGRQPSKRGVGVAFGPDVTRRFLEENKLDLIVRSHEVKDGGYEVDHNGLLVTIFSAPNYCDQMGNKGAFIRFHGKDMVPHYTTFTAAPHPQVKPMQYASQMMWGM